MELTSHVTHRSPVSRSIDGYDISSHLSLAVLSSDLSVAPVEDVPEERKADGDGGGERVT